MPFVVDGYNFLHAVKKSFEQLVDVSDIRIVHMLNFYAEKIREAGQVVFDGIGPVDKSEFEKAENIEVIFSGEGKEADDVIERIIEANTAPKRLVVVSDDRRLKAAAKKRKCQHVDCLSFMLGLVSVIERGDRVRQEPESKNAGISKEETEGWMDEFGL